MDNSCKKETVKKDTFEAPVAQVILFELMDIMSTSNYTEPLFFE